jgi:hypothetical protein
MVMAVMLRVSYESARPRQRSSTVEQGVDEFLVSSNPTTATAIAEPPWLEEVKEKELRRYEEAQDRKWRNWLEAMSK